MRRTLCITLVASVAACGNQTKQGEVEVCGQQVARDTTDIVCLDATTDASLANLSALTKLSELDLFHCEAVTDTGVGHIAGLRRLRTLSLSNTQVSDAGLAHLEGLRRLEALSLSKTNITGEGLTHLGGLGRLWLLDLACTEVGDADLAQLRGLTELRSLDLTGTKVSDAGVEKLQRALPDCIISREEPALSCEARGPFAATAGSEGEFEKYMRAPDTTAPQR